MQEPPWMPRTEEEYRQQVAEDAGPQPDELTRLQMDIDSAEEEIEFLKGENERLRDTLTAAQGIIHEGLHGGRATDPDHQAVCEKPACRRIRAVLEV